MWHLPVRTLFFTGRAAAQKLNQLGIYTIGDLAGNTGEKSVDNFILSANIFQRFFANPVLVICTFAGLALVIAAVIFFVAKKRKKAE